MSKPNANELAAKLPPLQVDGRLQQLHEYLSAEDFDAAVITASANVRWLTGFTGSNGTVVLFASGHDDSGQALLITDARYAEQAPAELTVAGCKDDVEVLITRRATTVASRLESAARLGLEDSITWREQLDWSSAVNAEILPLSNTVEQLRAVKNPAELARMQAAAAIADEALTATEPMLRPGVTEIQFQQALDAAMRDLGASGPAYDTIVASGPNSALPHARPTDRKFQTGDLVLIDVGATVDGYRSDMTRTFVLGDPDDRTQAMLEAVQRSQSAGVQVVRPSVTGADIDSACRMSLASEGMEDAFVHSTGHGVGLDIHELPTISALSDAVLTPGNILTVEPGVYFSGFGGVRIEDLLVVTDGGCKQLTRYPKKPLVPLAY